MLIARLHLNPKGKYMFVIMISYKKSLKVVDKYIEEHREFLDDGYKKNYFIVSGPKNPRTGGVIISQLTDRQLLEDLIKSDPFRIYDVADYEIVEFSPTKYHAAFSIFL